MLLALATLSSAAIANQSACRIRTLVRKEIGSRVQYSGVGQGKNLYITHADPHEMGGELLSVTVNGKACASQDLKKIELSQVKEIDVLTGAHGSMSLALITNNSESTDMLLLPIVGDACATPKLVRSYDNKVDLLSIASEPSEVFDGTRVPLVVARTYPDSDGSGTQILTIGAFDDNCNSDNGFSRK